MTDTTNETPSGVVAILTAPDGHVVTSVSDFRQDRSGGMSLHQCQEYRAHRALAGATIRAFCSDVIADVLEPYDCERILDKLTSKRGGYRVTILPIGPIEDPTAVVARDLATAARAVNEAPGS